MVVNTYLYEKHVYTEQASYVIVVFSSRVWVHYEMLTYVMLVQEHDLIQAHYCERDYQESTTEGVRDKAHGLDHVEG